MGYLDILERNQQALRLAGVGALLHNLGKISSDFLHNQLKTGSENYLFQHILQLIEPLCPLDGLWDNCDKLPDSDILHRKTKQALNTLSFNFDAPFDDRIYVPGDMIEYLGVEEPWYTRQEGDEKYGIEHLFSEGSRLTHLMYRAHHGASGGEKQGIALKQQHDEHNLLISTPFGWEDSAASVSNIEELRHEIERVIQDCLLPHVELFSLTHFYNKLECLFKKAIADTRRPLNDVTIWDIGHTGMAFLITSAIGFLLKNRVIKHDDLYVSPKGEKNQLFWRVVHVRTEGTLYLKEATSIADLRVRKKLLVESFDRVYTRLEQKLLYGIEVYRDENGSFYIVPDFPNNDSKWQTIKREIEHFLEIDGLKLSLQLASSPLVAHPTSKGGNYIGSYISDRIGQPVGKTYQIDEMYATWQDRGGPWQSIKEKCTGCNIRPQGYGAALLNDYKKKADYYSEKAKNRNICCLCMHRRSNVSKEWVAEGLNRDTIWTYETTDKNGRIALLVGKWDFQNFVSFMAYPSSGEKENEKRVKRLALKVEFWGEKPSCGIEFDFLNNRKMEWNSNLNLLIEKEWHSDSWRPFKQKKLVLYDTEKLSVNLKDIVKLRDGEFKLTVKEDMTEKFNIGGSTKCMGQTFEVHDSNVLLTCGEESRRKILDTVFWGTREKYPFIVRDKIVITYAAESQSFARIRRVWETTRKFWQEILPSEKDLNPKESLAAKIVEHKQSRLEIKVNLEGSKKGNPGQYHVYDLVLGGGAKLDVVWDTENQRFITSDNLDYLAQPEQLGRSVKDWLENRVGESLTIEEPDEKRAGSKIWGKVLLEKTDEIPDSAYIPTIPILSEPRTFMALVPADKALNIMNGIKIKYEREMGKVRNRLPLHLGAVYFHRRTPLRAALDAGRAMLVRETLVEESEWIVHEVSRGVLPKAKMALSNGTSQFNDTIALKIKRNDEIVAWHIPAVMGDGETPDDWYPYVVFCEDANGNPTPKDRQKLFLHPKYDYLMIHAAELKQGDKIQFCPSTFDFEFLDVSERRFDIFYDADGRRPARPTRPFYLEDLDRLDELWAILKSLEKTQRYKVVQTIETTREMWFGQDKSRKSIIDDGVFKQFVADTLAGAAWPKEKSPEPKPGDNDDKKQQWDELVKAGTRGELADLLELRMELIRE